MSQNILVPDIGDFESVEIIEVLVKVGDEINKDDPVVTLESDKSSVEVPSPLSGKISELAVKVGDKVSKGSLLAKLENGAIDGLNDKPEEKIETASAQPIEIKQSPARENLQQENSSLHPFIKIWKERGKIVFGWFKIYLSIKIDYNN